MTAFFGSAHCVKLNNIVILSAAKDLSSSLKTKAVALSTSPYAIALPLRGRRFRGATTFANKFTTSPVARSQP